MLLLTFFSRISAEVTFKWETVDLPETGPVDILRAGSENYHFDEAKKICDQYGGQLPVPKSELENARTLKLSQMLNVYNPEAKQVKFKVFKTYKPNTKPKKSKLSNSQNVVWLGLERSQSKLTWHNIYTRKRIKWTKWATSKVDSRTFNFPSFYNSAYYDVTAQAILMVADPHAKHDCLCVNHASSDCHLSSPELREDENCIFKVDNVAIERCRRYCKEVNGTVIDDKWGEKGFLETPSHWVNLHRKNVQHGWRNEAGNKVTEINWDRTQVKAFTNEYDQNRAVMGTKGNWKNFAPKMAKKLLCIREKVKQSQLQEETFLKNCGKYILSGAVVLMAIVVSLCWSFLCKRIRTRGGIEPVPFGKVVLDGYADDGGLYVPVTYPTFEIRKLRQCKTYSELAAAIFRQFIDKEELSDSDLENLVTGAYKDFPADPVPVKKLHDGTYAIELFHGPTFCFKDLGQQILCRFIAHFVQQPTTLLASTTGDTGPAAVHAVESLDSPNLCLLVAHPYDQISELQRRQMTTVKSDRVRTVTFHGGGDDLDGPIKRLRANKELAEKFPTCGINSYNFGRVLAQTVHYFWAYFKMTESDEEKITIALPIGAMGNIAAGVLAKKCGLNIENFIGSVNVNDITHRVFSTGVFKAEPEMIKNLSEAINIQAPYNFERLLYWSSDNNPTIVKDLYDEFEKTGSMTMPEVIFERLKKLCTTYRVEDEDMLNVIRDYANNGYLLDPHSAVGYYGAQRSPRVDGVKVGVLCTAHWCKFERAMKTALGDEFNEDYPDKIKQLMASEEVPYAAIFTKDKNWDDELLTLVRSW